MADLRFLTDDDVAVLKMLAERERQRLAVPDKRDAPPYFNPAGTSIYVAEVPPGGIPGLPLTDSTVASADCAVQRITEGELETMEGFSRRVYNISVADAAAGTRVPVLRDAYGNWFTFPASAAGGGSGTVTTVSYPSIEDFTEYVSGQIYFNSADGTLNVNMAGVWYIFCVCDLGTGTGTAGDSTFVTISTVDGSPTGILSELRVQELDGFLLTHLGTNIWRLEIQDASLALTGVINATTQTIGGDKTFKSENTYFTPVNYGFGSSHTVHIDSDANGTDSALVFQSESVDKVRVGGGWSGFGVPADGIFRVEVYGTTPGSTLGRLSWSANTASPVFQLSNERSGGDGSFPVIVLDDNQGDVRTGTTSDLTVFPTLGPVIVNQTTGGVVTSSTKLADPNADRVLFWDDSAGSVAFLTFDTGDFTITGTTITLAGGGTYTDTDAQDAVGAIVVDSATIDFTYVSATSLTAIVIADSIGPTQLADTTVTPGSYTSADITVDAQGRITAAANGSGGYTDADAEAAIAALLQDTDTVAWTNNPGIYITADVLYQMSITSDASGLKLDGDEATPADHEYYGKKAGTKGWYQPDHDQFNVLNWGSSGHTADVNGDSFAMFEIGTLEPLERRVTDFTSVTPAGGDELLIWDITATAAHKKCTVQDILDLVPGGSGVVVDRAYAEYTTNADLSTAIPGDDTIPQNTEGTEILTASITPKDSSNRIRVRFRCAGALNTLGTMYSALFVDSTANALTSTGQTSVTANYFMPMVLEYEESAASTSARTYKIRVGADTGTMRLNGLAAGRVHGGVMRATLVVEEINPP